MHSPRPRVRRPYPSPSITSARQYLDHVLEAKGIELPDLPPTCVITYCGGLLEQAIERGPRISFDIGVTVPTEIHLVDPEGEAPYAIVAGRPGAPMAAVLLEELIALGFERFLAFGTAGYPASGGGEIPFGQIVVPDRSYVYEGTSWHYEVERDFVRTDWGLRARIMSLLRDAEIAYVEGPAATTDALYRETPEFIRDLLSRGVRAVEMELSALLSVSRFHDRPLAAALCISDVIDVAGEWRVGMTSDQIRAVEAMMVPVMASAAAPEDG
jgi:uridine phosphorylase